MKTTKTREVVALVALVAAVFVASGCGDDDDDGDGGAGNFRTIEEGKLRVGSEIPYVPFEFGKAPDYQGFDVDTVELAAKGLDLEVEFVNTPFDTIFRNLAQGKFDMVASATIITREWEQEVDFSEPYFPADQSLMVKKGSEIETVDDLDGQIVGAELGTVGAEYAKDETDAKTVRTFALIDDAFNALSAGQVDAVINDCPESKYAERGHRDLTVVRAIATGERYGFAFASDSDELRTAFNAQLAEARDNGELEKVVEKWFGTGPCKGLGGSNN